MTEVIKAEKTVQEQARLNNRRNTDQSNGLQANSFNIE